MCLHLGLHRYGLRCQAKRRQMLLRYNSVIIIFRLTSRTMHYKVSGTDYIICICFLVLKISVIILIFEGAACRHSCKKNIVQVSQCICKYKYADVGYKARKSIGVYRVLLTGDLIDQYAA